MPVRIQRKRTKGWKMPENTVYVGRPTKWGNPFKIADAIEAGYAKTDEDGRALVVECFREWIRGGTSWWQGPESDARKALMKACLSEIRGKNLACFCRLDQPCHADVLLEIANA